MMHLGYATSSDGITWARYSENPIYDLGWVEDMSVIKSDGTYYMFAEGKDDVAHLLTSTDRIHWKEQGALDVRMTNGQPISKGAYGTPAIWKEKGHRCIAGRFKRCVHGRCCKGHATVPRRR